MEGSDNSRKRPLDEANEGGVSKKSNQGDYLNENVHLKILIPSIAAGAVIGKGGETITQIQKDYGATIKMSKSQDFYPGTNERVCLVVGTNEAVLRTQRFITKCIRDKPETHPKTSGLDGKVNYDRHKQVKILVPNSTAGMIIGKSGNHIRDIIDQSGAFIQVSQKSKEMNLPERCITVAGEEEQCENAMALIVKTISEDPQSSSCPNISYHDYRGPVASAHPSGSPFAIGGGGGGGMAEGGPGPMMQGGGGGHMMNQQGGGGAPMHQQFTMGGRVVAQGGGAGNIPHGGNQPNVFNNLGSGMHNLTLNSGGGGGMSPMDMMRTTLRGSRYSEHAIEEIINAVLTLSNYGLFGFSLNLSTLGLQQPPQGMGLLNNLANIIAGGMGQGQMGGGGGAMMNAGGAGGNRGGGGADNSNQQVFGPVGSTTTTKAGTDNGENSGAFFANSGGMNGSRGGNREPWNGGGFNPQGGNSFGGMNHNSFGLGMGRDSGDSDEQSKKEMEVSEHIVGAIIGPGGKGILEIQNYTGANVQISKKGVFAPGTRNRVVTITGPTRNVQNAEYVIRQRINQAEVTRQRSGKQ